MYYNYKVIYDLIYNPIFGYKIIKVIINPTSFISKLSI